MISGELCFIIAVIISLDYCCGEPRIRSFYHRQLLNQNESTYAQTNQDVLFKCETEGVPSSIQIRRLPENKVLNSSSHGDQRLSYLIESVTCDDMGIYECVVGNEQRKTTGVMLFDCPPLPCRAKDTNITLIVDINEPVTFTLCVLAYQNLSNFIVINKSTIKKGLISSNWTWSYLKTASTTDNINNFTITVKHTSITLKDYGELLIRVTGLAGVEYRLDFRVLLRTVDCPTELTVTGQGLQSVLLSWRSELPSNKEQFFHISYSKDNITWHKKETVYGESSANITGLLENTYFSFKVLTTNKLNMTFNNSMCDDNMVVGRTLTLSRSAPARQDRNQETITTYVPPAVVLVCAIIVFVVLSVRKERRRRRKKLAQDSIMETTLSNSISMQHLIN